MHTDTCGTSHRHSIYCILPPHVLREMARRGSAAQRNAALKTLALDGTHRTQRMMNRAAGDGATIALTGAPPKVKRTIFNSDHEETTAANVVRAEGQPAVGDVAINEAYDGLGQVFEFYHEVYQRNSIDGSGPAAKCVCPLRPGL